MVGSDIDTAGALQIAIEASPSGVLVVDPEGRIVLVNRGLERQFGYAREELVGQVVELLLPETLRPIQAVHRDGFVQAPGSRPIAAGRELVARRKDGSQFPVEIELNPFRTPNGLFVLASIVDVTDRRRSEEAHPAALEVEHVDLRRERTRAIGADAGRGTECTLAAGAGADRTGGIDRLDGPAVRGDRHGQGAVRDADPRARRPAQPADGAGELRGDSGDAHRKRAVRPGERGVSRERWRGRWADSSWLDHSTIFLDEIGDLPPEVQVKLLRVLEERQIERLGSPRPITVDTRIIAATHRNLEQRIAEGAFREDLYYRLNVFPIYVPPLRERVEDIPLLVWRFVEEFSKAFGKRIDSIDKDDPHGACSGIHGPATSASCAMSSSAR